MLDHYYVNHNPQPGGEHEVHRGNCYWLPKFENRTYLGLFATCQEAIKEARNIYASVDGCAHCSPDCHSR